MRVILTHEQADFDAVASQLGAWLLDRAALPVLPGRVNRNVRAFLTLYGAELPFIERGDLPSGRIDSAVLVDTQSLVSLKGMEPDLLVQVVDHHAPRGSLPKSWRVQLEPVGATATLLAESLRETGIPLSRIEATLLMLGIYEDTGSLTYTRTTARDLQAGAFLLDQGASLQIVGDFLNHPLSLVQQAIFDQLSETAVNHQVRGNSILVAMGDASGAHEELSTIAHKIRDLLDPDALVILVRVAGGVQLIGRATCDRVDVGALAAHFGGGGHNRAAAALVRSGDLDAVHAELIACLPDFVRPALTVEEIMSRGAPQVLPPDAPLEEALARMQRYGYEGYPVVGNGRILGLVTRRAVDRALAHGLNVTARAVMEAGEVVIHPDDPVEQLQRLMTDSGWGQIPVVERDGGAIVGIVTRTDLLKTLTPEPAAPGRQNVSSRLESALPSGLLALLKRIAEEAGRRQDAVYIVGGFVRDLLLNHPGLDFDLVVEGDAIGLARALASAHGGRVTAHQRFGTAKWLLGRSDLEIESIDFVAARTEFYAHPTALPTVERGSIKLDLHRRDFTMNTLALRLDGDHFGELHDYWGGMSDLRQGLIRVLHSLSFVDDPTRMLRAVRFEQRFAFAIEARTLELLEAALGLLQRVSGDRIRHEIEHMLDETRAHEMFLRLDELGLLTAVHPEMPGIGAVQAVMFKDVQPDAIWDLQPEPYEMPLRRVLAYLYWFQELSPVRARRLTRRLRMRQGLETAILDACRLRQDLPDLAGASPSDVTFRLEQAARLAVYAVWRTLEDPELVQQFEAYVRSWRHLKPRTNGHDLRARGLPVGPAYKTILTALRRAWLDGVVESEEQELALLDSLIESAVYRSD